MLNETPKFLVEKVDTFSHRYKPRNQTACRLCRLAKKLELNDFDIKSIEMLGLAYVIVNIRDLSI